MIERIKLKYKALSADGCVTVWLSLWWVINLITSGASELANDEAYYHIFAQNLAWGYFDHPPMTALLVWLGEHLFSGELGVRFFFTLLQPLYLYIFWRCIRPSDVTRRNAELYVMISAAMLILQLYGLIAVPDGPLMFFTALFLLTFKFFTESRRGAWLAMGVALGLLALSKYHGALVLLFALLANVKWFLKNPRKIGELALSGVVALAIITPHLLWQKEHDWVSFAYHLSDRNKAFKFGYIVEFLANMLVVFSPFFVPLWVQSMRKVKASSPLTRTLKLYPAAFILFFTISSFRGYVQPQWCIVATYGFVWLLWSYAQNHERTRRYVMRMGWTTLALILLVRIVLIFNPIGLRAEVFNNQTAYSQMAEVADGRPLIVNTRYTTGAKYAFYTGQEVYCQSSINHRTSEWQFRNDDDEFIGCEVIIEVNPEEYSAEAREEIQSVKLSNGRTFSYVIEPEFRPVRKVEITAEEFVMPESVAAGDKITAKLRIDNPYPYDIRIDNESYTLAMCWRWSTPNCSYFKLSGSQLSIPANGSITTDVEVTVPGTEQLPAQRYKVGFAVRHRYIPTWYNSKTFATEIK